MCKVGRSIERRSRRVAVNAGRKADRNEANKLWAAWRSHFAPGQPLPMEKGSSAKMGGNNEREEEESGEKAVSEEEESGENRPKSSGRD